MIKRTVDISQGPTFVHVRNDQLVLERDRRQIASIPCEDVGVLLVDSRQTTFTCSVVTRLAEHGAVVVFCDEQHLPASIAVPSQANQLIAQRVQYQASCPLPRKKRLWQQIVREKILRQAANLPEDRPARRALMQLAGEVRSGDTSNCEGRAAAIYWPEFLGPEFRRNHESEGENALLNYGYTVMRAAIARSLVGAGLHPALGLHHRNRSNAFCLADDLVEPFRPVVDKAVWQAVRRGHHLIDQTTKGYLLGLLSCSASIDGQGGPLLVQLHKMAYSLVECLSGNRSRLLIPRIELMVQTDA